MDNISSTSKPLAGRKTGGKQVGIGAGRQGAAVARLAEEPDRHQDRAGHAGDQDDYRERKGQPFTSDPINTREVSSSKGSLPERIRGFRHRRASSNRNPPNG